MRPEQPCVAIVIANYNGAEFLPACLESIRRTNYEKRIVIVVDNGSEDESVSLLREQFPEVVLIQSPSNRGFGAANNIGIQRAFDLGAEYIAFLNNDTRVDPGWLKALIRVAQSDPNIAVCGCRVRYWNNPTHSDGAINFCGLNTNRFGGGTLRDLGKPDIGQYDRVEDQFAVLGAAFLAKAAVLKEIGDFDEDYFLHYEENDLCWRAWIAGYRVVYVPDAVVYHRGSASLGKLGLPMSYHSYSYFVRHKLRSMLKNWELKTLIFRLPVVLGSYLVLSAYVSFRRRDLKPLRWYAGALAWNVRHFPSTLKKRRQVNALRRRPDAVIDRLHSASVLSIGHPVR